MDPRRPQPRRPRSTFRRWAHPLDSTPLVGDSLNTDPEQPSVLPASVRAGSLRAGSQSARLPVRYSGPGLVVPRTSWPRWVSCGRHVQSRACLPCQSLPLLSLPCPTPRPIQAQGGLADLAGLAGLAGLTGLTRRPAALTRYLACQQRLQPRSHLARPTHWNSRPGSFAHLGPPSA